MAVNRTPKFSSRLLTSMTKWLSSDKPATNSDSESSIEVKRVWESEIVVIWPTELGLSKDTAFD